ncbi:MAG: hypothetical protein AMXMBFR52_14990 [Burkholderiales bacterium]|jgi:hypothetical protein|nr:DDE-type integrase/transposase/recombinase [Burkholderiaceae bacterium]
MFQYRQVLVRLRAGDTTRQIARSGLMGRDKLGELRTLALSRGWLDSASELPDDEAIAAALTPGRRASSTISSVEPFRQAVQRWVDAGVQSRAIHAALKREHGFAGSYSAVVRMARSLRAAQPPEVTVRLSFAPAEAAQVDFGAGPVLTHPDGKPRRTWAFVMTLCHSRHQYVEFVWDQSSATWLGCHRRAFEWFDGVPERITVDIHGRPQFARHSHIAGEQGKVADIHPAFRRAKRFGPDGMRWLAPQQRRELEARYPRQVRPAPVLPVLPSTIDCQSNLWREICSVDYWRAKPLHRWHMRGLVGLA